MTCGVDDEQELEKWSWRTGMIFLLAFLLLVTILANVFKD